LTLYLATIMFYWWPMAQIGRALWYAQAALFVLSTVLNLTSHKRPEEHDQAAAGQVSQRRATDREQRFS
jgi:hypothetical protein